MKPKEPILSILLNCILPGWGHWYGGSRAKGTALISLYFGFMAFYYTIMLHPKISLRSLGILQQRFGLILTILFFLILMMVLLILVDGYKCTRAFNKKHFLERKIGGTKKFFLIIGIILASLGLNTGVPVGLIVRTFFAQAFKIPSGNMRMTLIEGDRLFANKLTYRHKDPERGDIAVFVYPVDKSRCFIKRVIAKGGEYVEIRDGGIYINDVLIELPSIKRNYYYNSGEYGQSGKKIKVPDNHYFVLGDNSQSSHDSRYWGFIPRKNFIGKAYKIYYPFSRSGPIDK